MRHFIADDKYDLIDIVTKKSIYRYDDGKAPKTPSQIKSEILRFYGNRWRENYPCHYCFRDNGHFIGYGMILPMAFRQAEIGFVVHPKWQGEGYATEMLSQLIDLCKRRKIHRVFCTIDPRNIASKK